MRPSPGRLCFAEVLKAKAPSFCRPINRLYKALDTGGDLREPMIAMETPPPATEDAPSTPPPGLAADGMDDVSCDIKAITSSPAFDRTESELTQLRHQRVLYQT